MGSFWHKFWLLIAAISIALSIGAFWMESGVLHLWTHTQFGPAIAAVVTGIHDGLWLSVGIAGITVGAVLLLTFIFGRWYCVTICPLGILQDMIAGTLKLIFRKRYKINPQPNLRKTRYIIALGLFAALIAGWAVPFGWVEPFTQFGSIVSGLLMPGVTEINNEFAEHLAPTRPEFITSLFKALVPLVILTVLVAWRGLIFCTVVCPVGTVLGVVARRSIFRLNLNKGGCVGCKKCEVQCPAGCIDLQARYLDNERCFLCMKCVNVCPKGAISYGRPVDATPEPMEGRRKFLVGGGLSVLGFGAAAVGLRIGGKPPASFHPDDAHPILPPGAGSVERFREKCTGCQLCVQHCEGNVLRPAGREFGLRSVGQPHLKFEKGLCEFNCIACLKVCPTGALRRMSKEEKRRWRIGMAKFIPHLCVSVVDGTDCGACAEHCPTGALTMVSPSPGATRIPHLDERLCIGCGNCEYPCPVRPGRAIIVTPIPIQVLAADPAEVFKAPEPVDKPATDDDEEWPF